MSMEVVLSFIFRSWVRASTGRGEGVRRGRGRKEKEGGIRMKEE